ncbi:MAG: hypothetical protein ACP5VC_00005, partial [Bryobacteraceae bacterium]
ALREEHRRLFGKEPGECAPAVSVPKERMSSSSGGSPPRLTVLEDAAHRQAGLGQQIIAASGTEQGWRTITWCARAAARAAAGFAAVSRAGSRIRMHAACGPRMNCW